MRAYAPSSYKSVSKDFVSSRDGEFGDKPKYNRPYGKSLAHAVHANVPHERDNVVVMAISSKSSSNQRPRHHNWQSKSGKLSGSNLTPLGIKKNNLTTNLSNLIKTALSANLIHSLDKSIELFENMKICDDTFPEEPIMPPIFDSECELNPPNKILLYVVCFKSYKFQKYVKKQNYHPQWGC